MNKKFLSAVLFGALLASSTGTFVSCKDYDDDIKNLQEQIDQQKGLSEKLTTVETTISSLQSAQTELSNQIAAAKTEAEQAALTAQQKAVEEAAAALEAAKANLKKTIEDSANASEESLKAATDAINVELGKVQGQVETLMALNDKLPSLEAADAALSASVEELDAKVAENAVAIGKMEAALTAQQTALEEFKTATGTDVAGLQTEINELKKALDVLGNAEDLSGLAGDVETLKGQFTTLSASIQAINSELDLVWAAVATGVTHVSLMASADYGYIINGERYQAPEIELLSAKSIADYVFGEGLEGEQTFVKGQRNKQIATLVVRVSPVTADLNEENIHFIGTQADGATVDLVESGLVKVTKAEPYKGEVLSRSISASGLWKLTLEVGDNYDETAYDKATLTVKEEASNDDVNSDATLVKKEKPVLFALKVADKDSERAAVSSYDLAFTKEDEKAEGTLNYRVWVEETGYPVTALANRYTHSEEDNTLVLVKEYTWKTKPEAEVIKEGALANVIEDASDNRNYLKEIPIVSATEKSFTIELGKETSATHFYIVLDKERAVTSDDSELDVWNELREPNIIGINQVYSVSETGGKATIGFTTEFDDVLGFRVFAINSNGTLVDPDGRAFYVHVGKAGNVVTAGTATVVADASIDNNKNKSDKVDIAADMKAKFANVDKNVVYNTIALETDKIYIGGNAQDDIFDVMFEIEGEDKLVSLANLSSKIGNKLQDLAKIKSVVTIRNYDAVNYVDDQVYNGKLLFKNDKNIAIATLNVSMKKVLPTELPGEINWNPAQLQSDGKTYKCYVLPYYSGMSTPWNVYRATEARMEIADMFDINTNTDVTDLDAGIVKLSEYTFYFTTNDPLVNRRVEGYSDEEKRIKKYLTLKGDLYDEEKDEFKMIDDTTPYDVYVTYNYGKVSSKTPDQDLIIDNKADGWKAIYCNIHGASYSFDWASAKALNDGLNLNLDATKPGYKFNGTLAAQAQKVVYGENFEFCYATTDDAKTKATLDLDYAIYGTSTYHAIYNGWLRDYSYGLEIVKDKCSFETVDNPGKPSKYFEIEWNGQIPTGLKALDKNSNPTAPVDAVLKIAVRDNFHNERIIEMKMRIVPNLPEYTED